MAGNRPQRSWPLSEWNRNYKKNLLTFTQFFNAASTGQEHRASILSDDGTETHQICWHRNSAGLVPHSGVIPQRIPKEFVVNAVDTVVAFFDQTSLRANNGNSNVASVASPIHNNACPVPESFLWLTRPAEDFFDDILSDRHFIFEGKQSVYIIDLTNIDMPIQNLPGRFCPYRPPFQGTIQSATQIATYTPHDFLLIRQSELWPDFLKQRGHLSPELFMPLTEHEERYLDFNTLGYQEQVPLAENGEHSETITISQISPRNGYGEAWVDVWCCVNTGYSDEQIERFKVSMSKLQHAGSYRLHIYAAVRTITSVMSPCSATPRDIPQEYYTGAPSTPLRHRPYKRITATQIIGTGLVHLSSGTATLHGVSVRPEFSGRGVGTALVDYAKRFAREEGMAQLAVAAESPTSHFFRCRGFTIWAGWLHLWTYDPKHAAAERAKGAVTTPLGRISRSWVANVDFEVPRPLGCRSPSPGARDGNDRVIQPYNTAEARTAPIPAPPPMDRKGQVVTFEARE
ncbi:hypothetical protein F4810DRAFT_546652 [Camillea tinctor]|nr:hypothetical protein F4810DRAFT_546652 [Camillea tinctor]